MKSRPMFSFYRWVGAGLLALALTTAAMATSLLPNGKQQFIDGNGNPYASGKVYFYIPGTTVPKNTYQDSSGLVLNTNPVVLDAAGRAIIYGSGAYRQILKDAAGNTIWDQLTSDTSSSQVSWSGNAGGTANAITVTAPNFTSEGGQGITFRATNTNTGPATISPNSTGPISILKDLGGGLGSIALSGGEISAGAIVTVTYDAFAGAFHLSSVPSVSGPLASIAAATTTNLGSVQSNIALVTGDATITSFGTRATLYAPTLQLTFTGTSIITYNATSLITPSGANITTSPGDSAVVAYLGSSNWRVLSYTKANATPNIGAVVGLTATNNSSTPNTKVDVTASAAVLEGTLSGIKFSSVSVTIDAGTVGANGLDAGSLVANTWYYEWLISDGSVIAGLLSTSSSAPTMPTGYTYKLRVGAIQTDGSSVFYRTKQRGKDAQYVITAATNTAAPWTIALGTTSSAWVSKTTVGNGYPIPPTATMGTFTVLEGAAGVKVKLAPNTDYSTTDYAPFNLLTGYGAIEVDTVAVTAPMMLESTAVGYWSDNSSAGAAVLGWKDQVNAN